MPLWITEDDVTRFLTMDACLGAVEAALKSLATGGAANRPRSRAAVPGATLHVLPAASATLGRMAVKAYATTHGGARFVVLLFDATSSGLLAAIEGDRLGQMRTGAATGVATRLLALPDAAVLGIIGTGWQARSQVQAIARVRRLDEVRAFGRDRGRVIDFCGEIARTTGVAVRPAASAEAAVRGATIVVTATNAATPVLEGAWLSPGAHVNAVGSNRPDRRELDAAAVSRADLIVCDSVEQARQEAGDLILAGAALGGCASGGAAPGGGAPGGGAPLDRAVELSAVLTGTQPGRTGARQITLFKSLGLGIEDLAAASFVYDRAVAAGAGRPFPPGANATT
jgi:ornithine cyclodeaminase/alanine dehydrogenase-like protein (mu-crystallin family)